MIDGFLAPAAFALAALAIPILLTYMLKARRPRQVVPSTFLWREATQNVAASRPWQRLRPTLLLLLQLLLLILLVLALARPFRDAPGIAGRHLVLVVDTSGSMMSTDDVPTRIQAARREGERLLETLSPEGVASVIAAGPRPRVLISASPQRAAVRRALADLEATNGPANFAEAFLLAESLETPSSPAAIVIISDGGMSEDEKRLIPEGAVFRTVGRVGANLAITRLDIAEGPGGFRAFAEVRNFDTRTRATELSLDLDGTPVTSVAIRVPAEDSVEKAFDLGAAPGRLLARITSGDSLSADNQSLAVLERTRPKKILVATPGNVFLQRLLEQLPGAEVQIKSEPSDTTGFDLAVYDRVAVPEKLPVPAVFIAPTKPPAGVTVTGEIENPTIGYLAPQDPLLEHVDLSEVAIARAQRASISGGRTLVGATAGTASDSPIPLIATWSEGTLRRVWFGFDLHASNLPLQVAFPILGDHLLGWLTGAEGTPARYAGDVLSLAAPAGTTDVRIRIPGGRTATLKPGEPFAETDRAGIYEITFMNEEKVLAERSAALAFPPSESEIAPKAVATTGGGTRPGLVSTARRPVLVGILLAALAIMVFEWWWAYGRPRPKRASTNRTSTEKNLRKAA